MGSSSEPAAEAVVSPGVGEAEAHFGHYREAVAVRRQAVAESGLEAVRGEDTVPLPASERRSTMLCPANSMSTRAKASGNRNADDDPVHSLSTLIDDLATITRNNAAPRLAGAAPEEGPGRPRRAPAAFPFAPRAILSSVMPCVLAMPEPRVDVD